MEPTLAERLSNFIAGEHLAAPGDRILLTVSGGSDSMTLADLFSQCSFEYGVAHCNFQLRGEDSLRDEAFVRNYCEQAGIPFYGIRFDTTAYAAQKHLSIQEAARELRYGWFEEVRVREGYAWIATAHHRTDHVETLLLNFCKGSGIHGLHGIPVRNGRIIRPMLFVSKKEVWQYIAERQIAYVEDVSNQSLKYKRNFLRHRVIPLLEEGFPGIESRLAASIARFREVEALYEQAIAGYRKDLITRKENECWIPIAKLKKVQPLATVVYELFRQWDFSPDQCTQIISIMDGPAGKTVRSSTHQLIRDRVWFIIAPVDSPGQTHRVIDIKDPVVTLREGTLRLKRRGPDRYVLRPDPMVAALDASELRSPVILRRWKQGDYFYPLGMHKKKKLSRFFIDEKVPVHRKEQLWVLVSGERIAWIVGMRIDDRFKITPATTSIVECTFSPAESVRSGV